MTHPNHPLGELEIALYPAKNDPVDIHVKVYVGPPGADLLQVFDDMIRSCRFNSTINIHMKQCFTQKFYGILYFLQQSISTFFENVKFFNIFLPSSIIFVRFKYFIKRKIKEH